MLKHLILLVFALGSAVLFAQGNSKTEAEIRQLEQSVVNALLKADTNKLKQLWAPEFLVNNPRNDVTESRDSVLQLQKAGLITYSRFERNIERMQFQKDLVITIGYEIFVPVHDIPGAKAGQVYKRRFTDVWMKKKGKWQQIARHASIICQ